MLFPPPERIDERELYTRSPFQVALLFFVTLGLYVFWWSYRVRRSCAALLEEPDSCGWKSVGLIVPLLNLYLFFDLFEKIKIASMRAGLQPPPALAAYGIIGLFAFVFFGVLPLPYASLAMLYFVPFAVAHMYLQQAQQAMAGAKSAPQRFGMIEIALLVLGGAFRVLVMIGYTYAPPPGGELRPNAWFAWGVLGCAAAFMVYLYRRGTQANEALQP
jgi:hypothetical protein